MPDRLEGRTLGDFRLDKLIGRGSVGRVYRAVQLSLNRTVAVKVLEEGLFSLEEITQRFLREAEFVARLEHPHIVPVYAAGREEILHFFAMRFVDGPSLSERMERGMSLGDGLRFLAHVADALAYAHARGLVHRDVKPANILIADDSALLTDFGLARMLEGTTITASNAYLGTPRYFSPEQARQERATARSDLYSLGVILYEIAVGRHPFAPIQDPGPSRDELISRIASGRFDPPREIRPDLPEEIDSLLRRAMTEDPGERYSSGVEMRQALERALARMSAAKSAGKTFGKFLLQEKLGHGGMGIVYKAHQTDLRRDVALKVLLNEECADETTILRFEREARSAARLRHPNIVPIHEIGETDGRHWFTMDYIDGEDLEDWAAREKPGPRRTFEIVHEAAQAIAYAHDQGVVHRDLKPANILIERSTGRVLVTDFGLAKDLKVNHTKLTASGEVMGTPSYMAPEQLSGTATPLSDVYALGAILYDLLTGRPPHDGATPADTVLSLAHQDPPAPRSLNPNLHRDAETICLKALERDPRRRYATTAALVEDCRRFLSGEPIGARPMGPAARLVRKISRHRAVFVPILVAVAIALAAASWAAASALRSAARVRRELSTAKEMERMSRWREARDRYALIEKDSPEARDGRDRMDAKLAALASADSDALQLLETARAALDAALRYLYDDRTPYSEILKRLEPGETAIRRALAGAPHLALGHYLLGRVLEIRGEDAEAERCWREAVHLDLRFSFPRLYLARLLLVRAFLACLGGSKEELAAGRAESARWIEEAARELEGAQAGGTIEEQLLRDVSVALLHLGRGESEPARAVARAGLQKYPREGQADCHWLLALTLRGREALEHIDRSLALHAKHWQARFERGLVFTRSGEYAKAIVEYSLVLETRPRFKTGYLNRGLAYAHSGDHARALSDYDRALEIDPGYASAYLNRGASRAGLDQVDAALADYTQALRCFPRMVLAYTNRAGIWIRKKEYDRAIADCTEALAIDSTDAVAYLNRGLAREKKGEGEPALADFDGAVLADPNLRSARQARAELRIRRQMYEGAIQDATELIRITAGESWTYALRARARFHHQEYAGAIQDHTEVLKLDQRNFDAWLGRADAFNHRDNFDAAIQDATKALELKKDSSRAYTVRGFARHKKGDQRSAAADFTEAIRLGSVVAYLYRGAVYHALRNYAEAIRDFSSGLERTSDPAPYLYNRAVSRAAAGDRAGAMIDAQEALRVAPKNWDRRRLVEELLEDLRKKRGE